MHDDALRELIDYAMAAASALRRQASALVSAAAKLPHGGQDSPRGRMERSAQNCCWEEDRWRRWAAAAVASLGVAGKPAGAPGLSAEGTDARR
jgi:hypothetical protein